MGKFDLLKFAFKYFYPRKHREYDGVRYRTVEDDYDEWFNSIYTNGTWYIGEADDTIITQTRERSIPSSYAYLVEGNNRLFFCIKVNGFGKVQKVPIKVDYTIGDGSFSFETEDSIYKNNYLKIPLDDTVTFSNVQKITVKSIPSVIENYILYTTVGSKVFEKSNLVLITAGEFNLVLDYDKIIQKLASVPKVIRYSTVESDVRKYGFRLKDFKPFLYDTAQEVDFHIKSYKSVDDELVLTSDYHVTGVLSDFGSVFEEDLFSHDSSYDGWFDKLELDIVVSAFGEYNGLSVHLVFDVVQGNAYNDASLVEY